MTVYFLTTKSMPKNSALVFAICSLVLCGASTPSAGSPGSSGPAVKDPAAGSSLEIPTECATSGAKICTPPTAFVAKLCQSKSPDVALSMFRKSTPWTRAYLRRDMEAWYTGVRHSSPVQMVVDEEVIVVATRSGGTERSPGERVGQLRRLSLGRPMRLGDGG